MEVRAKCQARELTLYLKGELDHHGAKGLIGQLEHEIEVALPTKTVLDFSGITFMDSSGTAKLLLLSPICSILSSLKDFKLLHFSLFTRYSFCQKPHFPTTLCMVDSSLKGPGSVRPS